MGIIGNCMGIIYRELWGTVGNYTNYLGIIVNH